MDWRKLSSNTWKKIKKEGSEYANVARIMGRTGKEIVKRIWDSDYAMEQSLKGLRAAKQKRK